jgi:hypothetical protein
LIYLGFITEGKLAAVLITPSLAVPNWSVIYIINTAPSICKGIISKIIQKVCITKDVFENGFRNIIL